MEHQEQQPPQHRQGHPKEGMQNPNSHEAVSLGLPENIDKGEEDVFSLVREKESKQ